VVPLTAVSTAFSKSMLLLTVTMGPEYVGSGRRVGSMGKHTGAGVGAGSGAGAGAGTGYACCWRG